jgi:hypothetical protein
MTGMAPTWSTLVYADHDGFVEDVLAGSLMFNIAARRVFPHRKTID